MYDPAINPSVLFDGLFVNYYLLSDDRLSALAKLVYVFLAGQASPRGEVVPDVPFIARALGAEGHQVYEALNQLEQRDYFTTRRSSGGTEFIHCRFVTSPWLKSPAQRADDEAFYSRRRERRQRGRKPQRRQNQAARAEVFDIGRERRGPSRRRGSEFPLEVCREWALHCERRGDEFPRGVEYFAGWLYKFGEQDEDIRRWLRENPRGGRWPASLILTWARGKKPARRDCPVG
jgi:hypothetical protein